MRDDKKPINLDELAKASKFWSDNPDAINEEWNRAFRDIEAHVAKENDKVWEACFADVKWYSYFGGMLRYLGWLMKLVRRFPSSNFLKLWHNDYLRRVKLRDEYIIREHRFHYRLSLAEDFAKADAARRRHIANHIR